MQRVVIIGFGFMGKIHAAVYKLLPDAKVVAVVDPQAASAYKGLADLEMDVPVFETLEACLESTEFEVADICLPTNLHARVGLQVIPTGKAMFVEKPVALTLEDAESLRQAADAAGTRAQVGHCLRFWPEYRAFRDIHRSGQLGQLLSITMQRRGGRPGYTVGDWLNNPERSGGAALDLHIHDTDFLVDLLGMPQAVTSEATFDDSGPAHIFTRYHYADMIVHAEGGLNYPVKWGFQMAFQALFENAAIEYDVAAEPSMVITRRGEEKKPLPFEEPKVGESKSAGGNVSALGGYYNELRSFINCLENDRAPEEATLAQACQSLKVTLAEIESSRRGTTIEL